jgi:starch phosphorylase
MPNIQLFNVAPNLPEELKFLETLSYNLWWCWHHDAIELFRRIRPALWKELGGNARRFLSLIPQEQLRSLARDKGFL